MKLDGETVRRTAAALERESRVNLHRFPIEVVPEEGNLVLQGEVESVAAKKIALETAAAIPGVEGVVDRLRVFPVRRMQDGEIIDRVCDALIQEHFLEPFTIEAVRKGRVETVRSPPGSSGTITVEVADGVVTFNGSVASLAQKRLAGVMAWWVAGTRDVVNGLDVSPPEEDTDGDVVDAVRLALEEDPMVNASQVKVDCSDYVVTLDGAVATEEERKAAENDAWCIFRVNEVVNRLEVVGR